MPHVRATHRKLLRRFAREEGGAIAVMFALMLPVLFGIIGLGVEAGIWFKERRELQTIADSAAVAAAIERAYGADAAEYEAAAQLEADVNGFDAATDAMTYVGTPTSGAYSGNDAYTEIVITRQLETVLSQVFYAISPVTTARAVAGTSGDQEACVLALSTSAMNAIYTNGAGTDVSMDGCALVSNSNHGTKSVNAQNGSLDVECIWAAGGIDGEENITTNCGSAASNASTVTDPYADLTVPADTGCDHDPPGNQAYQPANGALLSPGIYCGGITINAGATVSMDPGTYIMDDGDFTVNGGGSVTGDGVTIILTNYDGGNAGTVNFTGGATIELTAPLAGEDYEGVLVYQDRDGGSSPSMDATFNGGSELELGGAIYLPNNDISFTGGNDTDSNGCLMLVAQTISFNGDADIENNCDIYGGNPVTYGARPGLVE
ncbi:MAG: pilus assembly protein [Alphaproteobacteria bacterium]|nr:pilus assembly protein [Alphaproteobacteria bacterium]MBF0250019.1 pilus assembly protein [Alphaproteobacteria bacterium]